MEATTTAESPATVADQSQAQSVPDPDLAISPADPFPESAKSLLTKWGKLRIANAARVMCGLQRTANNCNKHDREFRDLGMATMRHEAERHGVKVAGNEGDGATDAAGDDEMEVRFDSPQNCDNTHTHHHYPAPIPLPKPGLGKLAKLAVGAGLLATGLGTGVAIPLIANALLTPSQKPAPAPATTPAADDTDTWHKMIFWPPKEPTK